MATYTKHMSDSSILIEFCHLFESLAANHWGTGLPSFIRPPRPTQANMGTGLVRRKRGRMAFTSCLNFCLCVWSPPLRFSSRSSQVRPRWLRNTNIPGRTPACRRGRGQSAPSFQIRWTLRRFAQKQYFNLKVPYFPDYRAHLNISKHYLWRSLN